MLRFSQVGGAEGEVPRLLALLLLTGTEAEGHRAYGGGLYQTELQAHRVVSRQSFIEQLRFSSSVSLLALTLKSRWLFSPKMILVRALQRKTLTSVAL